MQSLLHRHSSPGMRFDAYLSSVHPNNVTRVACLKPLHGTQLGLNRRTVKSIASQVDALAIAPSHSTRRVADTETVPTLHI